ncbi:hypothetical protein Droror1_Dr00027179 [Drosera rotundifolia]
MEGGEESNSHHQHPLHSTFHSLSRSSLSIFSNDRCASCLRKVTPVAAHPFVVWLDGQLQIRAADDGFIGLVIVGFDGEEAVGFESKDGVVAEAWSMLGKVAVVGWSLKESERLKKIVLGSIAGKGRSCVV